MRPTFAGGGVLNWLIDHSPFEFHLPYNFKKTYSYCGPGTRLKQRLENNSQPVNPLDDYCKTHDIAYSLSSNISDRHSADKVLLAGAEERIKAEDASAGEKTAAWIVSKAMKAKLKLGMGLKFKAQRNAVSSKKRSKKSSSKKRTPTEKLIRQGINAAKIVVKNSKGDDLRSVTKMALKAARRVIKRKSSDSMKPRIFKLPKRGGFLPLIPIFAALSAAGAIAGSAANIAAAVNKAKQGKKDLEELSRHNQTMEAIALGKDSKGSGFYIKPYQSGAGLFIEPPKNRSQPSP